MEMLETVIDKFTFKVAKGLFYSPEGLWAKAEGNRVRIGLTDYLQQHSGDMAFAEIKSPGTEVAFGADIATIETIKVNITLPSPLSGRVLEVNPRMTSTPEAINQDPYGEGWLAVIEASNWEADKSKLMDAEAYFVKMKHDAEMEASK